MSRVISGAILKEQLKRFWPLMLFCMLGYFLFVIIPIYIHEGGRDAYLSAGAMLEVLSMRNPTMLLATVLVPFGVVFALFSYLFSERAESGFSKLASSKNQLFWSNTFASVIIIVVPLIVFCGLLMISVRFPATFGGNEPLYYPAEMFRQQLTANSLINTFPVVMTFFARLVVSFMFFFTLFLAVVTICGNGVFAAVLCAMLPFVPTLFYRIGRVIPSVYVLGYDSLTAPLTTNVWSYTNPVAWIWESAINAIAYTFRLAEVAAPSPTAVMGFTNPLTWFLNWGRETQALYFIVYIAIILALVIIANLCFMLRKSERAGEVIVFRPLKYLFVFLFSVLGMLAMGGFVIRFLTGRWFLYYGFALGFVISFIIALAIVEKSFRIRGKIKWLLPSIGVAAVLYGTMLLITTFAARPYTQHVPQPHNVSGIHLSIGERWIPGTPFVTDPEYILLMTEVHERIIDIRSDLTRQEIRAMDSGDRREVRDAQRNHRRSMQDAHWQSLSGGGRLFYEAGGAHLYIVYRLNNGNLVFRHYALSAEILMRLALDEGD
jgi:hypothetical protein